MSSLAERMARLIVHGERPYNAEPPLDRLRMRYRTAAEDFYVRSHGDLPEIDPATWRLSIDGAGVGRRRAEPGHASGTGGLRVVAGQSGRGRAVDRALGAGPG